MKKIPKHFRLFLVTMIVFLAVDLATKTIFYDYEFAKGLYFIHPILNYGISWSIQIPVFVSVSIGWISLLLFFLIYHKKYISWSIAAVLVAGTLGNMIDRMVFGGVRDFIMIGNWFPIFNIADIFLNFGIIFYLYKEFFAGKRKQKQ